MAVPSSLPRRLAALTLVASPAVAALSGSWQKISSPTAAEAADKFANPPPEYSAQFTWGWGRGISREVIAQDLDGMKALGVFAAAVEPKSGLPVPYL